MELKDLKALLEQPNQLRLALEKLRLNTSLSEEIKGFIVLYDTFDGDCEAIKNYLISTEKQILVHSQPKTISFSIFKYAAGITLLIGIGSLIYYFSATSTSSNLNAKNEITNVFKEPGVPIFMGEKPKIEWGNLMYAIEKESPEKAIAEWKKIQKLAPENDSINYFGGLVYFNSNQFKTAEKYFRQNLNVQSTYNDRSLYFLAILDWKRNKRAEAKKKLLQLSSTSDLELKKAVKIHLKDIK